MHPLLLGGITFTPLYRFQQIDHRTVDELRLRDELQKFGEACDATVRKTREAAESAQVEAARLRQAAAVVEREQAAIRLAMREGSSEARS